MKLQASSCSIKHASHAPTQRPLAGRRAGLRVSATAAPAAPPATADVTKQVVTEEAQYVLQTYARPADIVFVRGKGSKLYDANDKEYLDMAAGVAHPVTHTAGCNAGAAQPEAIASSSM